MATATSPITTDTFLAIVRRSGVADPERLEACLQRVRHTGINLDNPKNLATLLVRESVLTIFQAQQLLLGRHRGFFIGHYRLLERLGAGGMGSVFLAEHRTSRKRVALKVLPNSIAQKPTVPERFEREARANAALDHPNVLRAVSLERDADTPFLLMEYIDGQDLNSLVDRHGALKPVRAAHYIRQAAEGLQHVHDAGLIHRDLKPANLLLDRSGTIKLLDLGLARFVEDDDELTRQQGDGAILGTANYLSPEQAIDSHDVDQRTDIYSLGATFYFLLAGQSPVPDLPTHKKLIFIRKRQPTPIGQFRSDVPAGLLAIIDRMLAKNPSDRPQTARDVIGALAPWTQTPIPVPTEEPSIQLSPLARAPAVPPRAATPSQSTAIPIPPCSTVTRVGRKVLPFVVVAALIGVLAVALLRRLTN